MVSRFSDQDCQDHQQCLSRAKERGIETLMFPQCRCASVMRAVSLTLAGNFFKGINRILMNCIHNRSLPSQPYGPLALQNVWPINPLMLKYAT